MLILGIDPGLTGALCVFRDGAFHALYDIPTMANGKGSAKIKRRVDALTLATMVRQIRARDSEDFMLAVVEQVAAMPGQGVASMFSLGETVGAIRGVLATLTIATEYVSPVTWKKAMKLGKDKDAARSYAIQRYPEVAPYLGRVKDHNRAEAVLLAAYGHEEFA